MISQEKRKEIDQFLNQQVNSRFQYPWGELESELAGGAELPVIGFGSLLNEHSARRTLPRTPAGGWPPVLAFGAKRTFNYLIHPEKEEAALNTEWTGCASDSFNGVHIRLAREEIAPFRAREVAYDLMPVAIIPWGEWDASPTLAFALRAGERPWSGSVYLDETVPPRSEYYQICREGAASYGKDFLNYYLKSTWTGENWPGKSRKTVAELEAEGILPRQVVR